MTTKCTHENAAYVTGLVMGDPARYLNEWIIYKCPTCRMSILEKSRTRIKRGSKCQK